MKGSKRGLVVGFGVALAACSGSSFTSVDGEGALDTDASAVGAGGELAGAGGSGGLSADAASSPDGSSSAGGAGSSSAGGGSGLGGSSNGGGGGMGGMADGSIGAAGSGGADAATADAAPACGYTNCAGCCDQLGVCQLGTLLNQCGGAGAACEDCATKGGNWYCWSLAGDASVPSGSCSTH